MLTVVAMVGTFQPLYRDGYYFTAIERQLLPPPSQQAFIDLYIHFKRGSYIVAILFFSSTWLVKVTFMLLYYTLFQINMVFRKIWWAIMAFIIITYWVAVAGVLTQCGPTKNAYNIGESLDCPHWTPRNNGNSGVHNA